MSSGCLRPTQQTPAAINKRKPKEAYARRKSNRSLWRQEIERRFPIPNDPITAGIAAVSGASIGKSGTGSAFLYLSAFYWIAVGKHGKGGILGIIVSLGKELLPQRAVGVVASKEMNGKRPAEPGSDRAGKKVKKEVMAKFSDAVTEETLKKQVAEAWSRRTPFRHGKRSLCRGRRSAGLGAAEEVLAVEQQAYSTRGSWRERDFGHLRLSCLACCRFLIQVLLALETQ